MLGCILSWTPLQPLQGKLTQIDTNTLVLGIFQTPIFLNIVLKN